MVNELGFKLHPDGHEDEEESPEQLEAVYKKLKDLKGPDGQLVTLGKQELSVVQKILSTATEKYREEQMWRMCDFTDDEEALDHVAAYYEARDLGMDTSFNVAYAFALCSTNRKGGFRNNLLANILDTLQHGKWASSYQKKDKYGSTKPRSPIGN